MLGERGWNTYMVGKWHLTAEDEMNLASRKSQWPVGRGFERFYGFLGAETNQWYPDLVYDNHPVEQPKSPEEGCHLTEDLTDKALEFIRDAQGGPNGSVNENKIFNGIPDLIEANLPHLHELGSPTIYNHYPTVWACAFNTPFKLWKRYSNWEGGTADPMIMSWPTRVTSTGVRRQYVQAVDQRVRYVSG